MYHSIKFLTFFKEPRPFKQQKTILSGLTTHLGASLDNVASAAKNSIAVCPEFDFSSIPVEDKVNLYILYFSRIFYHCTGEGATQVGAAEVVTFFLISLFIRNSIYM
jgi:hypothetical protein